MKILKSLKLTRRHKEMLSLAKDNWPRLSVAVACSAMVAAMTSVSAYLVKPAVEKIFEQKNSQMLVLIPVAIIAVFAIKGVAAYGSGYLLSYVGQDIIRRMRNSMYRHILELPLAFFQGEKTGDLMSRITNDVAIISSMFTSAITGSVRDGFTVIGLIGVTFFLIPKLAVLTFIVFPIAIYPLFHIGRKIRRVRRGVQESWADLSVFLHETFTGIKIVKAFNMQNHEKKRFEQKSRKIFRLEMKENKVREMSSPLMELLGGLGVGFIIWYGGRHVISGTYSFGGFMSFLTSVGLMYQPLKKISRLNNAIQRGMAALDRIYDILERKSDIIETVSPVDIPSGSHRIAFEKVSFKYDRDLVLKNITLRVKPGEIIALVGMSGGGKTSLVNLIPRFYDPT
jgi:subfamily B ATP-binding cassette protein MsbA